MFIEDNLIAEEPTQEPQQQILGDVSVAGEVAGPVIDQNQAVADNNVSDPNASETVMLTDDDINEDITERKSKVQKRIDKLTAEKYSAMEELEAVKRELYSIKETLSKKDEPKEKVYSDDDLMNAIKYGIEESDHSVIFQAVKELVKNEKRNALREINGDTEEINRKAEKESKLWKEYADQVNERYAGDPDYNLNSPSSAAYRYALHLAQTKGPDYEKAFGEFAKMQIANDAILAVTELKQRKLNSKQLRTTEKELASAKLKTQIPYGNASAPVIVPKSDNSESFVLRDSNTNDALDSYISGRRKNAVKLGSLKLV